MKTKRVIDLAFLLAIGLAALGFWTTSSLAQSPPATGEKQTPESALFKGLLKSMSLTKGGSKDTGLQKKTPVASQPSPGAPAAPSNDTKTSQTTTSAANPASNTGSQANPATGLPGLPGMPGICDQCGSAVVGGKCTGGKPGMPCKSPGSGDGSGGSLGDKGMMAGQKGSGASGAASAGNGTNGRSSGQGSQSNQGNQMSGQANGAQTANGINGGSMPPMPSGGNDPLANAQAIAARAAANLAASQAGGNGANQQGSIFGDLSSLIDSVQAGAAVGPGLRWKIVKPAGVGDLANPPAVSMDPGDADTRGGGRKAFQLDAGIVRSELVTGPNNPLLVPPEVASVVYVIDCSSSMSGDRFNRVARGVIDAVSQMTDQQQFAVLLFNTVAMQIDGGGLIPATAANRQVLASQLSQVLPVGGTDPTDALLIALQMKPETMVVFSDGEFDRSIVQQITSLNHSSAKRIHINCVGIQSTVSVLRELASKNGPGNYIEAL
jgi:hypothetical protein